MGISTFSKRAARTFLTRKQFNAALRATQSGKTYRVPCISHWYAGKDMNEEDLPDAEYADSMLIRIESHGCPLAPWCYVKDGKLHVPSVFVA